MARKWIRKPLEELQFRIDEATSGEQGLEKYSLNPYDIVTIDIVMPGIYGLDILLTLRELNPTARVIVVTADIQESTRREAQNRGAVAILKKPVNAEILKKTVVGVLAGSDQWQ